MKNHLLIILIFAAWGSALSQEKLPYADAEKLIEDAIETGAAGDYEKALELLTRVYPKDSLYCSALISKSYFELNNGNLEEAVKTTDEGLAMGCSSGELSFFINKGIALLNQEKPDEAMQVFREALKIYPRNSQLWFNIGRVLESQKKVGEAVSAYQNAILFKPSYDKPHLRLGDICYRQELITQALMSYNMFLLLNPDGPDAFRVLKAMNDLVRIKNPNKANPDLAVSSDDAVFEQLDLILDNKLALNDQYKVDADIMLPITKQNHLMMEQLASHTSEEGFWSSFYVPLYQWIWREGLFEEFTYTICYSIENEDYKPMVARKVDDIKEFLRSFYSQWLATVESSAFRNLAEDKGFDYNYESFQLDGIGKSENGLMRGKWKFFREDGSLSGEGSFDQNGNRTGEWKWYGVKGELIEYAFYEEGKLVGENRRFFENGKPNYVAHFENDEVSGEYTVYNEEGALLERKYFREGKLDGPYISNFSVGADLPEYVITYKNGLIEGKLIEYYADGTLYSERYYKQGKQHGTDKRFNRDGSLFSEINYQDGFPVGKYRTFYANGQIKESTAYQKGDFDGKLISYYEDGTIESRGTWSKGKLDGIYSRFDRDGILFYEFKYNQGELIAFKYFDQSGEIIDEGKKKGGEFYFRGYTPKGVMDTEGLYDISGGKKGKWKFYSPNGILVTEGDYQENKAIGTHLTYYPTGQKESVQVFKEDTLQGYYISYYLTGQMRMQGYYKDGQPHGEWRTYYIDGKLENKYYYHKDSYHNLQEHFGEDGSLDFSQVYEFGKLTEETFFDSKGEAYFTIDYTRIPSGKYRLISKHHNGAKKRLINLVNGVKHGEYLEYDANGNLLEKGTFVNGKEHGPWILYYQNGQVKSELVFNRGELHGDFTDYYESGAVKRTYSYIYGTDDGIWTSYFENGNKDVVTIHKAGQEHGKKEFFDPSGKSQMLRFYEHGRMVGYSYLNAAGEELPMIPIENETGKIKAYFDNGKISREMEFKNGELSGAYRSYYYSGQMESEIEYDSGEIAGSYKEYFANGNLKRQRIYVGGFLSGLSEEYFENGQLKKITHYLNDEKHGQEIEYNEQGKVLNKTLYHNGDVYKTEIL
ncbi:tetratricopeptide repeat protein [Salinimicrobium catena]|uniref:tetratricopeptide repeat protein n=1 Tax=Salinimicrobium catena TaxID=390640 RepID=UPI002FE4E25E